MRATHVCTQSGCDVVAPSCRASWPRCRRRSSPWCRQTCAGAASAGQRQMSGGDGSGGTTRAGHGHPPPPASITSQLLTPAHQVTGMRQPLGLRNESDRDSTALEAVVDTSSSCLQARWRRGGGGVRVALPGRRLRRQRARSGSGDEKSARAACASESLRALDAPLRWMGCPRGCKARGPACHCCCLLPPPAASGGLGCAPRPPGLPACPLPGRRSLQLTTLCRANTNRSHRPRRALWERSPSHRFLEIRAPASREDDELGWFHVADDGGGGGGRMPRERASGQRREQQKVEGPGHTAPACRAWM